MGAEVGLVCDVMMKLDARFPRRAATPELINAIVRRLGEIEQLYEAAPTIGSAPPKAVDESFQDEDRCGY